MAGTLTRMDRVMADAVLLGIRTAKADLYPMSSHEGLIVSVLKIADQTVVIRSQLKNSGRKLIARATDALLASGLGQAMALAGENLDTADSARLFSEHALDRHYAEEIDEARVLAYVETVDGFPPTQEWLDNLDEDDLDDLKARTAELEKARMADAPTQVPDSMDPDPRSPTGA